VNLKKELTKERKAEQQADRKERQRELHTPSPRKPKRGTIGTLMQQAAASDRRIAPDDREEKSGTFLQQARVQK
jgi:hypothetical protein